MMFLVEAQALARAAQEFEGGGGELTGMGQKTHLLGSVSLFLLRLPGLGRLLHGLKVGVSLGFGEGVEGEKRVLSY